MKRRGVLFTGFASAALAACATAGDSYEMSEKTAARLAEFEATGETESCLSLTRIQSITALDDRHLLVRSTGKYYYLNKVSGRCNGASRPGNRIQYTVSANQLCRNQIITIVENTNGFTTGSCGLNSFEKLAKVETE